MMRRYLCCAVLQSRNGSRCSMRPVSQSTASGAGGHSGMKSSFTMTEEKKTYDCAVIGGGLAGLCLSIQLARLGRSVVLFEKNKYPFHKVCGEYVSNEIAGFLLRLGLNLDQWELPQISRLGISSEEGFMLNAGLG